MKKETEILIPPEQFVADVAKKRPRSKLEKLIAMLGENAASAIMVEFAGTALHFPNRSTLRRAAATAHIKIELKGLRKGQSEFARQIKKLSILFCKKERTIVRIFENGKYE